MQHVMKNALRGSVALIRKGEEDDPVSLITKSLEDLQKAVDERLKKVEGGAELKALMDRLFVVPELGRHVRRIGRRAQLHELDIPYGNRGYPVRLMGCVCGWWSGLRTWHRNQRQHPNHA